MTALSRQRCACGSVYLQTPRSETGLREILPNDPPVITQSTRKLDGIENEGADDRDDGKAV
jgi:hypothetical protein